ncbi:hypothetical protein DSO57_1006714 [Entomophthora muscae]|uniref:Uncharacterized protein n=1 Tax=Entomophthora muscae TaxID=34485 RepID=A0ACC2UH99_9FUNG|nr:hypothetical protein DSO57_1006714 [Entomophthora muscae]
MKAGIPGLLLTTLIVYMAFKAQPDSPVEVHPDCDIGWDTPGRGQGDSLGFELLIYDPKLLGMGWTFSNCAAPLPGGSIMQLLQDLGCGAVYNTTNTSGPLPWSRNISLPSVSLMMMALLARGFES